MNKSESIVKLSKALLGVQKKLEPVLKDASNPYFKSKYADINSMLDAVLAPLNEAGILVLQPLTHHDGKNFVETMLIHAESGEFSSGETEIICAKPNDPQALGSAITYTRRYGVQSFLGLRAEDDDGNAGSQKSAPKTETKAPAPVNSKADVAKSTAAAEKSANVAKEEEKKPSAKEATFAAAKAAAPKVKPPVAKRLEEGW